ncbi:LCP family protein [Aeromicrobium massiliense]|uniref:LCP family protein n=1 Tax=Aeromicrobium massiliense TaxID=1464554 RepID=UPI00030DCBCA|nr:LCP family protein [Aeromicrobium massiliense]
MPSGPDEKRYDWLYDDGTSRPAPRAADELPPPDLPPPGRKAGATRDRGAGDGGRPRKRRVRVGRIVALVVVAWIVFLVAVPVWAWNQVTRVDADPDERLADQPGTTYLVVGSDSRKGLSQDERNKLNTGGDVGERTDTIMLLHVGGGPSLLMSIPRDSPVDIPGHGESKINAAYAYGGPELLVSTIEENTGIRVDDYVEIGLGGLVNLVDAVGGVEICPEEDLKDRDSGLDVKAGCQEADGVTALAYSRNRHSFATQDIQRVQNQRAVIGSIGSELRSPSTVLNPFRYLSVAKGGATALTIGDNVGPVSLARFALSLSSVMGGDGLNCTVPLADFSARWDKQRSEKMFDLIATDRTEDVGSLCTKDGLPAGE